MQELFEQFLRLEREFPHPAESTGIIAGFDTSPFQVPAARVNGEVDTLLFSRVKELWPRRVPEFFLRFHLFLIQADPTGGLSRPFSAAFLAILTKHRDELLGCLILFKIVPCFAFEFKVPPAQGLALLRVGLLEKNLGIGKLVHLLHDFLVDRRYEPSAIQALVPLITGCLCQFIPGREAYILPSLEILKRFIRISRSTSRYYLGLIFAKYAQNLDLDISPWVEEGARIIRTHGQHSQAATSFFDMTSDLSRKLWLEIDPRIHFEVVAQRVQFFARAITETPVVVKAEAPELGANRDGVMFRTDGKIISVPKIVAITADRALNFTYLLHGVGHECAHIEFKSFLQDRQRYETGSQALETMFPGQYAANRDLLKEYLAGVRKEFEGRGFAVTFEYGEPEFASFTTRLLFHAPRPLILRRLWNIVEDFRIEERLYEAYAGFRKGMGTIRRLEFPLLEDITGMPPFENLVVAFTYEITYGRIKGTVQAENDPLLNTMLTFFQEFREIPSRDTYDSMVTAARLFQVLEPVMPPPMEDEGLNPTIVPEEADQDQRRPEHDQRVLSQDQRKPDTHPRGPNQDRDPEVVHFQDLLEKTPDYQKQRAALETREKAEMACDALSQCDLNWNGLPKESSPTFHQYPEWDYEKNCYLIDHCHLIEVSGPLARLGDPDDLTTPFTGLAAELRRVFMQMRPRKVIDSYGMEDGDQIDFDAFFDAAMAFRSGHQMDANFFIQRDRRERSVVTGLILDQSGSTAEKYKKKTVFWHEKAAAYLLSEAIHGVGDPFGLFSMFDYGAAETFFSVLKGFDAPFSGRTIADLAAAFPPEESFSRFAVGLRHLIGRMKNREEKTKIIFFITDGVPLYFEGLVDKGTRSNVIVRDSVEVKLEEPVRVAFLRSRDQRYVLADLKKVYEEAVMAGIKLFCITIDLQTAGLMGSIFGKNLIYLPEVGELPRRLVEIFRKATS